MASSHAFGSGTTPWQDIPVPGDEHDLAAALLPQYGPVVHSASGGRVEPYRVEPYPNPSGTGGTGASSATGPYVSMEEFMRLQHEIGDLQDRVAQTEKKIKWLSSAWSYWNEFLYTLWKMFSDIRTHMGRHNWTQRASNQWWEWDEAAEATEQATEQDTGSSMMRQEMEMNVYL